VSSRRTLILLAAIAIGLIAAFALFNYVTNIEDNERADAELVPVLKAEQPINRGITGAEAFDAGDIAEGEIPREFRPDGFVSTIDEISGQVALFEIPPGSVLVKNMFVDPSQTVVSFRERLKDDGSRVAVSFSVDQVRGVADLLVPGDEVNIFVVEEEPSEEEAVAAGAQPGDLLLNRGRLLYADVHILAIGQTPIQVAGEASAAVAEADSAEAEEDTIQFGLITVDVPVQAAQWIISMAPDSFYLTLNPANYVPEPLAPLPPFTATLPGENAAEVTPYGPAGSDENE
jgi:Flp pilus assembly protein CpaB